MLCCSFPLSAPPLSSPPHPPISLLLHHSILLTDLSAAVLPLLSDNASPCSIFMQLLPSPSLFWNHAILIRKRFKFMLYNMCSLRNGSVYLHVNADALGMGSDVVTSVNLGQRFCRCHMSHRFKAGVSNCLLPSSLCQVHTVLKCSPRLADIQLRRIFGSKLPFSAPCRCGGGSRGSVKFCRVTKNKSGASLCCPVQLLTQDCCPGPLMAL